jgi:hypothetical protein
MECVRSEPLRSLFSRMLRDEVLVQALKVTPGAMRLHHAYRGGLLQYILSVLGLASRLTEDYPRLDLDLMVAGAILHDIGKIEELTATRRLGYSTRGQLVGHVVLGLERTYLGSNIFPWRSRPCCDTLSSAITTRSRRAHSVSPCWPKAWSCMPRIGRPPRTSVAAHRSGTPWRRVDGLCAVAAKADLSAPV